MIVTERERERGRGFEAGSMHQEPDVGLDPGTPGSHPGPKAGAKPLSHPGIPTERGLASLEIARDWELRQYLLRKEKTY